MCGRVLVGEQKDILITGRDGRQFKPKPNTGGNPGSMLMVVTDALPDKVQQYRWGLFQRMMTRSTINISMRKLKICIRYGVSNWAGSIA